MAKKSLVVLVLTSVCLVLLGVSPGVAAESLKVGVYGGYFKDSFDKHIFPDFTKETGIKIESIAEPTGEAWLVQLEQAAPGRPSPCGRLHDVTNGDAEGPANAAVDAFGPE